MSLHHLSSLLHHHQSWFQLLQSLSVFSCSCGRHADDPSLLKDAKVLTKANFIEALGCLLIRLLGLESLGTEVNAIAQNPETKGEETRVGI